MPFLSDNSSRHISLVSPWVSPVGKSGQRLGAIFAGAYDCTPIWPGTYTVSLSLSQPYIAQKPTQKPCHCLLLRVYEAYVQHEVSWRSEVRLVSRSSVARVLGSKGGGKTVHCEHEKMRQRPDIKHTHGRKLSQQEQQELTEGLKSSRGKRT